MSLHAFKCAADLHACSTKNSLQWNEECNKQVNAHTAGNKNQVYQLYTNLGFGDDDEVNAQKCAEKCHATAGCTSFSMPYPKAFYHNSNTCRCVLYMVKCKERVEDNDNTGFWRSFTPGCFADKCQEEWLDEQWDLHLLLRRSFFVHFSHTLLFVLFAPKLREPKWDLEDLRSFLPICWAHTHVLFLSVFFVIGPQCAQK